MEIGTKTVPSALTHHLPTRWDIVRKRIRFPLCSGTLVSALAMAGCAAITSGPRPTEADFAAIHPGMQREEVLSRVGPPTWTFGVRQESLTIWNYRYNRNDCWIYQISVRPDGTVRDAGQGWDPACSGSSKTN